MNSQNEHPATPEVLKFAFLAESLLGQEQVVRVTTAFGPFLFRRNSRDLWQKLGIPGGISEYQLLSIDFPVDKISLLGLKNPHTREPYHFRRDDSKNPITGVRVSLYCDASGKVTEGTVAINYREVEYGAGTQTINFRYELPIPEDQKDKVPPGVESAEDFSVDNISPLEILKTASK